MKLNLLTQNKRLANLLKNNLGYLGNELLNLVCTSTSESTKQPVFTKISTSKSGKALTKPSKAIVIVARQHYSESWKSYPAISVKELKSILKLQQQSHQGFKSIQRVVINKELDGFDVKTITFNQQCRGLLPSQVILIPETELLRNFATNSERIVAEIDTPSSPLYWAHSMGKVHSAYKKGLLNSLTSFMQSIGISQSSKAHQVSINDYAQLLFELVETTPINKLYDITSINLHGLIDINRLHQLYLAPLAVATIFVITTNCYFYIDKQLLDSKIEDSGLITAGLLEKKREIDNVEQLTATVNHEFSRLKTTHAVWDLLSVAMTEDMRVTRFKRSNQGVEFRGTAPKASKVLSALNNLEQVSGAVFVGSVRKSRGQDAFTILLQFDASKVNRVIKALEGEKS